MMNDELTPEAFWAAVAPLPPTLPVFYRLYYNNDGTPICYTMEDLPGNYIELDLETYRLSPPNVRVVDGKIVVVKIASTVSKLQPNVDRGVPCDPRDVCIIVDESQPHIKWSLKTNDTSA